MKKIKLEQIHLKSRNMLATVDIYLSDMFLFFTVS